MVFERRRFSRSAAVRRMLIERPRLVSTPNPIAFLLSLKVERNIREAEAIEAAQRKARWLFDVAARSAVEGYRAAA